MSTKNAVFGVFAAVAASAFATVPNVTYVHMEQSPSSRLVTIQYKFSGDDAVITLDVQTNANTSASASDPGWTSIGGEAICNAQGEVWRKVEKVSDNTVHTISWLPDRSWVGENGDGFSVTANGARAVVTAWATNNTPDYMVVDISNSAAPNTQDARCRYYPSVDFLPGSAPRQVGAVTNNPNYKTSLLVMRKIYAKDVTCILGSTPKETRRNANEKTRQVTIANNYYIGIFELTQGQWAEVVPERPRPSYYGNLTYRAARPVEKVCYNDIRCADCTVATSGTGNNAMGPDTAGGLYPDPPYTGSFLDRLRSRTGVDFDLPSETQWEFACRAGHGDGKYGNGSAILNSNTSDANLAPQTRYYYNNASGSTVEPGENVDTTKGTVTVGSCVPNDWGLYEMLGNVMELCLDKYQADVSGLAGAVKVDSSLVLVVGKGGHYTYTAERCRPAFRTDYEMNKRHRPQLGFRVVCRAGLD